jgi:hypothetical protein
MVPIKREKAFITKEEGDCLQVRLKKYMEVLQETMPPANIKRGNIIRKTSIGRTTGNTKDIITMTRSIDK